MKSKQNLLNENLKARIASLMSYEKWIPELISKRLSKKEGFV